MNNKGFAISGIIYGLLIIFLILIFSVLGILVSRNSGLSKIKVDAMNTITGKVSVSSINQTPSLIADFEKVYVNSEIQTLGITDYLNTGVKTLSGLDITNTTTFTFGNAGTEYDITYNAINQDEITVSSLSKKVVEKNDLVKTFAYTGSKQELIVSPGIYKLEVWGAESGSDSGSNLGSYAKGYLTLQTSSKLYIYVGGKGTDKVSNTTARIPGGFNSNIDCSNGSTGGGASDIRINDDSLYSRVITANGGNGTCGNGGSLFNITPGYVWSEMTKSSVESQGTKWLLKEKDYLINTTVSDKTDTFPSPSGTTEIGHPGNGYVKITYIVSYE